MKIAVDARSVCGGKPRGEGKSLLRLYEEIHRQKPDWQIVFLGQQPMRAAPTGIAIRTFDPPGFRFNSWENIALPWHVWRTHADVLHCSSSSAPRWSPVPIVMTVHDVIPLVANDGWDAAETVRFEQQLRYGLAQARRVITVSEHTRQDILRLFEVSPDKLEVVHWGIDAPAAPPDIDLSALGVREPYVMAFGGAARRKNSALTVRAAAKAAQALGQLQLVMIGVGDAATRAALEAQARGAGYDDVLFLDYIEESALEGIYRRAQCLVYASLYEGFGLPVLEAMARGVAVISSNVSSLPEVADDAALLVDPDDAEAVAAAIVTLCRDNALKTRLQEKGRARAAQFDWRETARRTIKVLEAAAR